MALQSPQPPPPVGSPTRPLDVGLGGPPAPITMDMLTLVQKGTKPPAITMDMLSKLPPEQRTMLNEISEALVQFWKTQPIHPIDMAKGAYQAATSPIETGKALVGAQLSPLAKAKEKFQRGDVEGFKFELAATLLPFLGPQLSESMGKFEEQAKAGDVHVGQAVGEAAGLAAQAFLPSAIKRLPGPKILPRMTNPTPAVREAVEFGQRSGIPIDAATATGNRAVRGVQQLADRSLGGAGIAGRAEQLQAQTLTGVGRDLAARASPVAATPSLAGEAVRTGIQSSVSRYGAAADQAYDAFRRIEAQPSNMRKVTMTVPTTAADGTTAMSRVTVPMQMPVHVKAAKAALRPIYERMTRQMPVTQQQAHTGLKAIKNILDAPDYLPASMVDLDLSAIKAMNRANTGVGHGMTSQAVRALESELQRAVAQGGRPAQSALAAGRAATIQRVRATDVLDQLKIEPQQLFANMTARKDAWANRLAAIAKDAPAAMPQVARALIDDIIDMATKEGGFKITKTIVDRWQDLGPRTRQLLFPDARHRTDLDQFFTLTRAMAENPNPSGTAHLVSLGAQGSLAFTNPAQGIPFILGGAALSRLLHSPAGVRALVNGLRLPVTGKPGAVAAIVGAIERELRAVQDAIDLPAQVPARAGGM